MKLRAPGRKDIKVRGVHPNQGVEAEYRRKLEALIDEMGRSFLWWIRARYRAKPPHASPEHPSHAMDASPARELAKLMRTLGATWKAKFRKAAKEISVGFATGAMEAGDVSFKAALKTAGFSVQFQQTRAMNDAYQAVVHENISLIRSIPSEYLTDVEGLVMRSVSQGRNLKDLTDELQARYNITRRRAAFIARDQNNKATSVMTRTRQREVGMEEAYWRHTSASVTPRESHEEADGTKFRLDEGCYIDGEYIFDGILPNCGCIREPIIPGYNDSEGDQQT